MLLYDKMRLLFLVTILWLLGCSLSFSQGETLTDEEYRQEIQTYITNPCFEEVGRLVIKTMELEEVPITGVEALRILNADGLKKIEDKLINNVPEGTKDKPKNERLIWYKVGARMCVKAWKEQTTPENELIPGMAQSFKALESENEPDNEPDDSINEKPSHSDTSVSAQAKRNAVKTCKESLQALGGKMSYGILNTCIEQELQAYEEFQRNYGD